MYRYDFNTVERVSKRVAKKLYDYGFDVLFIPCKANPENKYFNCGIWENKILDGQYNNFETLVNWFEIYNCQYNELGKYAAFYIKRDYKMPFCFHFTNGSNPYYHLPCTILDSLKELEKWAKNWNIRCSDNIGIYYLTEKEG